MDAAQFNQLADSVKKLTNHVQGDVLSQIKNLSAEAEKIANQNNPVVSEFEFNIGRNLVKANIHKNGNVVLLSQSNGVVEEIKKRLRDDRHI